VHQAARLVDAPIERLLGIADSRNRAHIVRARP
jgi:hypothetical protein